MHSTSIIPREVLGGRGHVPPSDKLNLGYIGCGTQGLREMTSLIRDPNIRIGSVCDPNTSSTDYRDWSQHGLRDLIRDVLEDPTWGDGLIGIPGGRAIGEYLVNTYYGKGRRQNHKPCRAYADYREMLDSEKDLDAVKVMTPDHLHAPIAIAAMRHGKHVVMHKPIANRLKEAHAVFETTRSTGANTHLLAWSKSEGAEQIGQWVADGAIGTLKEIHNWSNRPVWPQWTAEPPAGLPVPHGFDWSIWLGPVPDRPYHPGYTHMLFRGWYDFGTGSIGDMGHYSLLPLFAALEINTPPCSAEPYGTTTRTIVDQVSKRVDNDVAFPASSILRFEFDTQGKLGCFDLYWYDGGMRPPNPVELASQGKTLPSQGMMIVGDRGKILAKFAAEDPRLFPIEGGATRSLQPVALNQSPDSVWIQAFKNGTRSPGNFLNTISVSDTILLGAAALKARRKLSYNTEAGEIVDCADARELMTRRYRDGWAEAVAPRPPGT